MSEIQPSQPATHSDPAKPEEAKVPVNYGTFGEILYHLVSFTEGYEQQVLYMCVRTFETSLGFSKTQLSMLVTVSIMSRMCCSLVWGLLADAFPTNLVMSAGLLFMGIASILLSSTSHYYAILFLRFLHGAAFGCVYPVQQKIVAESDDDQNSSTFTRLHALNTIGRMLCAVITTEAAQNVLLGFVGWRTSYIVLGYVWISVGIAIVFAMKNEEDLSTPYDSIQKFTEQIWGALKAVFTSGTAFLSIFTMLIAEAPMCTLPYMITYLEYLGVSDLKVGVAIVVTTIGGAAGTAAGGIVIDKITSTHKDYGELIAGIVVMGVRLIVCLLFFMSPAPDGRLLWYHYIEFAILGATLVTVGGVDRPIMKKAIEDKYQASASAIIQCISGISISVSFVEIFGYLSEKLHGYVPSNKPLEAMDDGLKDRNTEALRKSTMYIIVIGSLLNIACYIALIFTYRKERPDIKRKNREWRKARAEKLAARKKASQEEPIYELPPEVPVEKEREVSLEDTLDLNVKKIVEANKKIEGVHGKLGGVEKSLGEWKQQAQGVLGRAIRNANEVYERLESEIGAKTTAIGSHNSEIQKANTQLATHVTSLQQWNSAAQGVITKAEGKCAQILEKVKTTDQKSVIFTQAEKLRDEGTRLLKAAEQAKKAVEAKVSEALEAVVNMDGDLKRDLKGVRDAIKKQIWSKIEEFQVTKLDNLVKGDLWTLKERIEGLGKGLNTDDKSQPLVKQALEDLAAQKTLLDAITSDTNGSIPKETRNLENKFNNAIKDPLTQAVSAVDQAIGTLGKNFEPGGSNNSIEKIFEHIKDRVGAIKGEAGDRNGRGRKGVDGIVARFKEYVKGVGNNMAKQTEDGGTVHSWLDKILTHNGVVRYRLGEFLKDNNGGKLQVKYQNENGMHDPTKKQTKEKLKQAKIYDTAKTQSQFNGATSNSIAKDLTSLMKFLDAYAKTLDEEIKKGNNKFVTELVRAIEGDVKNGNHHSDYKQENLTSTVEATLAALTADARRTAGEINSLLLNVDRSGQPTDGSVAKFLDKTKEITDDLDSKLTQATSPPKPDPAGTSTESPAQAVDSRLKEVRDMVNTKIEGTFTTEVTKDLAAAVSELPTAVDNFNQQAQEQIRAAATTAIEKAANVISEQDDGSKIDLKEKMQTFHKSHEDIVHPTNGLQKQLEQQVDKHIWNDNPPGGKINIKDTFSSYNSHADQNSLDPNKPENLEGKLPQAIGDIKTVGLKELENTIGNGAQDIIETTTFTGPFTQIQTELDEIKKLVDGNGSFIEDGKDKGVKKHLANLKTMLTKGSFINGGNGLEEIKSAIDRLQITTFTTQPAAIGQAVTAIKAELEELREKLKKDKDEDVIKRLEYMKNEGLGTNQNSWNPVNGKPLSGLGKIERELKKQNEILRKQPGIIDKAVSEIKYQLAVVGVKLRNVGNNDDILNPLQRFKRRIGKNAPEPGNLQKICNEIQKLQEGPFQEHPTKIQDAKQEIVHGLTALQIELQGDKPGNDVIKTLNDLKGDGLSATETWTVKGESKKGLAKIEKELQRQQGILHNQPNTIGQGVNQITNELNNLRQQLNTEVTEKLKNLKEHGLNNGDTPWTNESQADKGLTQITADIVTIKTENVEDAAFTLKEVKEKSLNELTGIKDQLNSLRIRLDRILDLCFGFLVESGNGPGKFFNCIFEWLFDLGIKLVYKSINFTPHRLQRTVHGLGGDFIWVSALVGSSRRGELLVKRSGNRRDSVQDASDVVSVLWLEQHRLQFVAHLP
ncbi:major facilitator superfamily member protein [Babesia ovata]|uniref:Major facilitator superfamily member protein n=1 Tax=Babesia ovata TaxID=189622 RepID=A0A2H6KDN5_9APIC|nr:major facilitator superfamily member protein [Babesia ovata]GBE61108.1 major facilitator superfamily member protein [Babesia ovata]